MKSLMRLGFLCLAVCVFALLPGVFARAQQEYSHARIVRLSFVEGTVTVQRADVPDWSAAPVNTPIQEGFKLATAEESFAEVEFENASSVRLGQLSLLEFTQLALAPSGAKINRMTLQQGYATFNVIPQGDDVYEVKARDTTLAPYDKTRFRIDLDGAVMRVEVLKGSVEVSSPYGSQTLAKDAVLEIRPDSKQAFKVSEGITKDDWDQWVDEREDQLARARNNPAPGLYSNDVNSYLYGWDDLYRYGEWSYLPGYGYGWYPYGVSNAWVPYSSGRWCWYPGIGYTWISFEPWGWLPYHFGEWVFVPGMGWCWLPNAFGFWSPAMVTWYQGPGWVAWAPRSPSGRPGSTDGSGSRGTVAHNNCPRGRTCAMATGTDTFRNGGPVTLTSVMRVDLSQARPVARIDLEPNRIGMLPGSPLPHASSFGTRPNGVVVREGAGGARVTSGRTNVVVVGAPSGNLEASDRVQGGAIENARAGESGIAFDHSTGRYENNPSSRPEPTSVTVAPRPAPRSTWSAEYESESGSQVEDRASETGPQSGAPSISRHGPASEGRASHPVAPSRSEHSSGGRFGGGTASHSSSASSSGSSGGGGHSGGGGNSGSSGGGGGGGGGGAAGGGGGGATGGGHSGGGTSSSGGTRH